MQNHNFTASAPLLNGYSLQSQKIFFFCLKILDNDDSFLQNALPTELRCSRHFGCIEYILQVYDELQEHSKELKEKIKEMIDHDVSGAASGLHSFLYQISDDNAGETSMKILQKHSELVERVLNLTNDGRTPLLNACDIKNVEVAKYLVQCGADVTIKDEKGETAVYVAAKNGLVGVVQEIFAICKSLHV